MPNLSQQLRTDLIKEAINEHWGERCADEMPTDDPAVCPCCAAWSQFDAMQDELDRWEQANTPFEDADPRVEIYRHETGYFGWRVGGCDSAPFKTWREAYQRAEGYLHQLETQAELDRLQREVERLLTFAVKCANDRYDCVSPGYKEEAIALVQSFALARSNPKESANDE